MSTPARTIAAIGARRANTQQMLQRVREAIIVLRRHKTPLTRSAVARRAAVSRTFLYENPDARSLVADAIAHTAGQRGQAQAAQDDQQEATWRERALNAEDALKAAHTEIRTQRERIAQRNGPGPRPGAGMVPRVHHTGHQREHHPQTTGPPTRARQPGAGGTPTSRPVQHPLPRPADRPDRSPTTGTATHRATAITLNGARHGR